MQEQALYLNLISNLSFFVMYIIVLLLQRSNLEVSSRVQRSILDSIVAEIPGPTPSGYTSSGLGTNYSVPSSLSIINWLNGSIFSRVFSDDVCGDGVCDSTEAPGDAAGYFGCAKDCGTNPNATATTIELTSFLRSRVVLHTQKWDLSHLKPAADPAFRFNLYSESLRRYVFPQDLAETTITVDLPDGAYRLELYQTQWASTKISSDAMFASTLLVAATVPARAPGLAHFAYGDYREFLSAQTAVVDAVLAYCYGPDPPRTPAGEPDAQCDHLFDKSLLVRALSGYGLAGAVFTKADNRDPVPLADVPFCSVFPDGALGLGGMRRFFRGADVGEEWSEAGAAELRVSRRDADTTRT